MVHPSADQNDLRLPLPNQPQYHYPQGNRYQLPPPIAHYPQPYLPPAMQGAHPYLPLPYPIAPEVQNARLAYVAPQAVAPTYEPLQVAQPIQTQAKQRPNEEPRPGGKSSATTLCMANTSAVFKFQVDVISGHAKREFSAVTDMSWMEFRHQVISHLDSHGDPVELAYKVSGDTGKASHLKNEGDYEMAIGRVYQRASNARTRAVGMEIKNIVRDW